MSEIVEEVKQPTQSELIDGYAVSVVTCMARGLVASLPNVPPEVILKATAKALGRVLGTVFGGEAEGVLKFRADCSTAMSDAMYAVKVPELVGAGKKDEAA